MDTQKFIDILKKLNPKIKQKYRAEIIGVFGSYVRKQQRETSDIDILVRFLEGATLFDFVELADYLEAKLKIKTDIVPVDTIREEIKESILKEAVYL